MTQNDWQGRLTGHVADTVRRHRKERGLSAQGLADACAALGYEIPRTAIANLENGRRSSVEIAEIFVLARALGIPPIVLLLPIGTAGAAEVVPGQSLPIWDAVAWFTAETLIGDEPEPGTVDEIIFELRSHAAGLNSLRKAIAFAEETRRGTSLMRDPAQRARNADMQAKLDDYVRQYIIDVQDFRARLRQRGIEPPVLPEDLDYLDLTVDTDGEIHSVDGTR
ncbi:helix-turn-helix domain-containing protein [Streptomyces sp. NPDC051018]|uniref:helix-turn-helix domain-containing protein n=1 Tax=Streptomyces sp. NPDC051018 TaxID=3365639 RepID=UPI00379F6CC0